jgi:hypothetical protein
MPDHAIYWLTAQASLTLDRPRMMFLTTLGMPATHHAPGKFRDMYKSNFAMGYDYVRKIIFRRQLHTGRF